MEAPLRRRGLPRGGRRGAFPSSLSSAVRVRSILRRAVAPIAVAALALGLAVGHLASPAPAQAMGPLPPCRYDDLLTTPRGYQDWPITLVDTILRVSNGYIPPDLVAVSQAGIAGSGKVRAVMVDDLAAMTKAAKAAGAGIGVQSAYRSYESQKSVFDGWVTKFGYTRALQLSARPGHSEHQLGLAIDFRSDPGGSPFTGDWGTTAAGKWMKAHAWEYGFVMSYPKGKIDVVCYDFEPWHYRYVGKDLAAKVRASGLTLRQYLWANFTRTTVPPVTPKPARTVAASATAAPTTSPTVATTPLPTAIPSPTPAPPSEAPPPATVLPPTNSPTPSASPAVGPGTTTENVDPTMLAGLAAMALVVASGVVLVLRRGRVATGLKGY